jgi:hypothetical protein
VLHRFLVARSGISGCRVGLVANISVTAPQAAPRRNVPAPMAPTRMCQEIPANLCRCATGKCAVVASAGGRVISDNYSDRDEPRIDSPRLLPLSSRCLTKIATEAGNIRGGGDEFEDDHQGKKGNWSAWSRRSTKAQGDKTSERFWNSLWQLPDTTGSTRSVYSTPQLSWRHREGRVDLGFTTN